MRTRFFLLGWLFITFSIPAVAEERAKESSEAEHRLHDRVKYLAGDPLEGRGIGTDGLNKAAEFIAGEFGKSGLRLDVYNGSPFQKFTMTMEAQLGAKEKNKLAFVGPPAKEGKDAGKPQRIDLKMGADFNPLAAGGTGQFDAPLVFVGYGITAKEPKYDDYEGLKVEGKVVVLMRKEPQQDDPRSPFDGAKPSQHALFNRKIANAFEHGAAAVIIVNDDHDLKQKAHNEEKAFQNAVDKLVELRTKFREKQNEEMKKAHGAKPEEPKKDGGKPDVPKSGDAKPADAKPTDVKPAEPKKEGNLKPTEPAKKNDPHAANPHSPPNPHAVNPHDPHNPHGHGAVGEISPDAIKHRGEVKKIAEQIVAMSKKLEGDFDEVLPFNGAGPESSHKKLPVYFCLRSKIDALLNAAGSPSLAEIEQQIDGDLKPRSVELAGWKAVGETDVVHKQADVKNVIGVIEGEGPLADETIVIGAHYDHLGRGGSGSLAPWTSDIHNGADDNASGTASLLEVARHFGARSVKPNRRLVFIAFTGEERGLIGSARYCKEPRFPLEKTIAMVNMDMVGRLVDNKLIVYGTGTAPTFDGLIEGLNKKFGFKLTKHPEGFGPSDHASFYAQKIPVFHFFTGTHNDYHRPSDDFDKINAEGMRRITEMVVETVAAIDADPKRPEYREVKGKQQPGRGGDRPYFGSIPDFAQEGEGYALMGVAKDSPAERAGLKKGDVIIKVGDSRIGSLDDFDSALRKFKAGDKAPVTVKRDKETVTVEVLLAPPR